jgi:hypothetical protein
MNRIALLVGINRYESDEFNNLECCVADARDLGELLGRHQGPDPGTPGKTNYACRVLTSDRTAITAESLSAEIDNAMSRLMDGGEVLFYFSGHGLANAEGGFLVTQDGTAEKPGYPMQRLLEAANRSGNVSVVIILDCCHGGQIGNVADGEGFSEVLIGPNVTVLAAAGNSQKAAEGGEHSLFTQLVIAALDGGAVDVCGDVSAASVYAYAEQALGPWEQRPVYKSYARQLRPIRRCRPLVPDQVLAQLADWFFLEDDEFPMDPGYEYTTAEADPAKVAIFDQFKLLRDAGLLRGRNGRDLYWTAMESGSVCLTPQGKLFWKRAKRGDF